MEHLELEYFYETNERKYEFYGIPQLLIDHETFDSIDYRAKLLYALCLNRQNLSQMNIDKFSDEHGRIYIIFTIEQVMEKMRCSRPTAIKMLKQLERIGLIEKKRQGQGKASIIYVKNFAACIQKSKFFTSGSKKELPLEVHNIDPSNNNNSNNNFIKNTQSINHAKTAQNDFAIDGLSDNAKTEEEIIDAVKNGFSDKRIIPQHYCLDKRRMNAAIDILLNKSEITQQHFVSELDFATFDMFAPSLVEMACAEGVRTYKECKVTREQVVERINLILGRGDSLYEFAMECVDDYVSVEKIRKIKAKTKYMQSVIWNGFHTYRVKQESYFERTFPDMCMRK